MTDQTSCYRDSNKTWLIKQLVTGTVTDVADQTTCYRDSNKTWLIKQLVTGTVTRHG